MQRLRLSLRLALAAAASTAFLACASSSSTPSEAPPPCDPTPPAPAAASTHDLPGDGPDWYWGEPASATGVGEEHCFTYANLAVRVGTALVQYDAADMAPGCAMGPTAKSVEVGSERDFRGVVGTHLLFTEDLGSEIYNLMVYDGSGSEVFRASDVPPFGETRVDTATRQLTHPFSIGLPDGCSEGLETYAEQEKACWAEVQRMHPVLKDAEAPGCDCGPGGLWPYLVLHKTVSLDALSAAPVETLPLTCGCSS